MHTVRTLVLLAVTTAAVAVPGSVLAAPPDNDDFASAVELFAPSDFAEGTNVDATKQAGEPQHAGNAGGASVWYRWTALASGRVVVSTCESDFNTLIGVYTGDAVGSLVQVASNDDACGEQSRLSFQAVLGTTYRIAVDGFDGDTGLVSLALDVPPPNDDFASSQTISGDAGTVGGTNVGATTEPTEPFLGARSVWFRWTAPSSGWATFETCGADFDTVLGAFTGTAVDQLSLVAASDDACDLGSQISFEASAGTVYHLAVAGFDEEAGSFVLAWNRNPPAPEPVTVPVISGVARDGETLTTSDGSWTGVGPLSYSYAWGRCDRAFAECELVPGATARSYTIRSVDVGFRMWVRVTASNVAGSTPAFSDLTSVVVARAPFNRSSPVVDGEARLGAILVASPGEWLGTAPISFAYQWQACNAAVSVCSDLPGQTGQVMRVSSVDVGDVIRVVVTATNVGGSATAASLGTDVERPFTGARPRCVVPRLRGKTLRSARAAIRRNRCRVGRVQRRFSRVRQGLVISQTPRAGRRLAVGTRVNLVVSKGKRR